MLRVFALIQRHKATSISLLLLLLAVVFLGPALFPPEGQSLGTHDTGGLFAPWFKIVGESLRSGTMPFWDPYQFVGYPFLSNPQVGFFYPPTWLAAVLPANMAISWYVLLHLWLSAVGMMLFARRMGAGWLGATLAAIAYSFSGFMAARLWAGHIGLVATFTWLPWVILATQWSIRRSDIWAAIVAGMPVGLAILAGHTPSFLHVGAIWLAFVLYDLLDRSDRRRVAIRQAVIMIAIGLGLAAVQLLPFIQLSLASGRVATADFDFATSFSLPPAHLVTLLLPEFFGEPTRIGYWSVPTFEELAYYAGLLTVFGLVLALRKPNRLTWFYILLMVFGLWMAMGSYSALYRVAYQLVPFIRLLRAPARSAVIYSFAASALLAHGLTIWQARPLPERSLEAKPVFKASLLVVLLAGVAAIAATGAVFMAVHPTETSGRLWHQLGGYALAVAVLLMAIGLLWGLINVPADRPRRRLLLAGALLVVSLADLWSFGAKLIVLDDVGPNRMWQDAKGVIGDTEQSVLPWGVSIFDQSGSMEVGLRSVFGYQALEPGAMVAFTSHVADPRSSAYDILGARYVVAPVELGQFVEGDGALELVAHQGDAWVYRRPRALPAARLAQNIEVIVDDATAIARVHQPDFDPSNTVILDRQPACELGQGSLEEATTTVDAIRPVYWRLSTSSSKPAMLVLAESNFPGWQAEVDGESVPVYRAFTTIRALCIPAGEHVVEWEYRPRIFALGGVISFLSIVLVVVALIKLWRTRATLGEEVQE